MHRCLKCGQPWDDTPAQDNELTCTRPAAQLAPLAPLALPDLDGSATSAGCPIPWR